MNLDISLREAQDQLRERLVEGDAVACPCCSQTAKIYKRTIFSTMARHAITLYRTPSNDNGWLHLPSALGSNDGSAAKLAYWGLLEEHDGKREDGGRPGLWRLTDLGKEFVIGRLTVPKYAHTFNGRVLKLDGPPVGIWDCLGDKFNYNELMGR